MTNAFSIRRVHPADVAALIEFYASLSPASRRARFLGCASSTGLSGNQSLTFCAPDHVHAEGFVAISERPGDRGAVLGHLCLEPAGDRRLELAVAVADAEHGHGIGRQLFESALEWAAERSYRTIVASCFADNARVLRLLTSTPHPARVSMADAGVVNVAMPLADALPREWSSTSRSAARRRPLDRNSVRVPCHAFWRRMPPPASRAGG